MVAEIISTTIVSLNLEFALLRKFFRIRYLAKVY